MTKFLALVLVAGGVGVALGMVLVSADNAPSGGAGAAASAATATDETQTPPTAPANAVSTAPPVATVPVTTPPTTTAPVAAPDPLDEVRLSVLDARLFTDETPSGAREQRARVTVRIRAENSGAEPVTLERPLLRVGSVRIPTDPDADALPGSQFAALRPDVPQTATLRFSLAGEATPKVVRDRRARVLIAGQSLAMRVKVRAAAG